VTRYRYNQQVNPPAPFVHVVLQRPIGEEAILDLPAQMDTAADLTVVPLRLIEELGLVPFDAVPVLAFGGILTNVPTFLVRLSLRGQDPVALEVLGSAGEPHILLGRDLLNRYRFVLDGPRLVLEMG
jgi:predicted aspartyl protease